MRNRIVKGFLSGVIAGVPMELFDWLSHRTLHFAKELLRDDMSELIYGHSAKGLADAMVAEVSHFLWLGLLGIGLTYLSLVTPGENKWFRGWLYSVTVWLAILTVGTFFRIPLIWKVAWQTATSNLITASVWGLLAAACVEWLVKPESASKQP